jgi:predicted sugar kinase
MNLKLRGSECDCIEWKLSPFKVGKIFWKPKKRKLEFKKSEISLSIPYRVAPIILDLSKFSPTGVQQNSYGAGELSLAVNPGLELSIELLKKSEITIEGTNREAVIMHMILIFRKLIGKDFGVRIKVKENDKLTHMGLGTTPTLFSGVAIGINALLGKPFKEEELAMLVSFNYGEEFSKSKEYLVPGLTTGGAFWNSLKGGVTLVSGSYQLVFNDKLEGDPFVLIGIPRKREKDVQNAEKGFEIPIMDLVRKYDRFDAGKICYWTLMNLLPAIKLRKIKEIGEIIWDVNLNTAKAFPPMIKHKSFESFPLMTELYSQGNEIVFLSSAGPSIVAVTSNKKIAKKIYEKYNFDVFEAKLNNTGIILKENLSA